MTPPAPDPSERARKLQDTRTAIEHAALRLFAEHGFDRVTTADIAGAVGIAPRTFFRHFPGGKDELMLAEERRGFEEFFARLVRRPPHEPAFEAIRQALWPPDWKKAESRDLAASAAIYTDIARGHEDLIASMLGDRQLQGRQMINHLALRMSVDPAVDLRPALIAHGVMMALTVSWLAWMDQPHRNYRRTVEEALDLLAAGLAGG